jgi:hypothetical protein
MRNFKKLVYGRICIIFCMVASRQLILPNPLYDCLWTILETIPSTSFQADLPHFFPNNYFLFL